MSCAGKYAVVSRIVVDPGVLAPVVISRMLRSAPMWFDVLSVPVVLLPLFVTKLLEFRFC
jgi:hypothetical protein